MPKFFPRQRKHKVLARERAKENRRHEVADSNQEVIDPAATRQQNCSATTKRAQLQAELRRDVAAAGGRMSSKKAKRLEKYIDTKLRKDENRELLAKLAAGKVDTSLFKSSKSLGQGRETKRQALSRALRETRAGIEDGEELLQERRVVEVVEAGNATDDDGDNDNDEEEEPRITKSSVVEPKMVTEEKSISDRVEVMTPALQTATVAGSGLKRPLEVDEDGRPVLKKRQKRGGIKSKFDAFMEPAKLDAENEDDEWGGISDDGDEDDDGETEDDDDSNIEEEDDENEEGSSDDENGENENDDEQNLQRSSIFKAWATQQRNEALGFDPNHSSTANIQIPKIENFVPRAPEHEPLPMELQPTQDTGRKAFSVTVTRTPEIQEARLKLPVVSEEQKLMEAIHNNNVVVICGATGSGKTTQVPQFLFEAGYGAPNSETPGMIGVTQPRRVAAVSMSKRVGEELGDHSCAVGYQIRFEGSVGDKTAVKFMTDGILLREVAQDITLKKYSAIIIDEAHERSVNTDILIGMLSRVVKLRAELALEDSKLKPLKLIIMSATLRIEDLTMNPNLFPKTPPVLEVEGRQYPVTMHFARKTHHDYVEEAFRKISRGHRKLPPGGFLVFLTGRNEILQLSKRLKTAFGGPRTVEGPRVRIAASEAPLEVEDLDLGDVEDDTHDDLEDIISDDEEDEDEFEIEQEQEAAPLKAQVLPLYSLLPTREQMKVFQPAPEGTRQIILATNVAETSLTIPGTRFVFDCGRAKDRNYDRQSGVQSYDVGWISKASANQRAGRAGRTGPGHCYRLYSSAVFERDFQEFADPELLRMPIEGVVLQLKSMNLQNVVNFPFPTPPERQSLAKAEKLLEYLSAISSSGQITQIGQTMSLFPLSPRFARILLVGHLHDCLPYTIALVAGLSAAEVFLPEAQAVPAAPMAQEEGGIRTNADVIAETKQANARCKFAEVHHNFCYLDDKSDAIKLLQVVGEFAHEPTETWCESHFVRFKVLKEIQQLRRQIAELLRTNIPTFASFEYRDRLDPPSAKQVSALKQMAAAGFIDQVAIRADLAPVPPEQHRRPRRAIDVPYVPLMPLRRGGGGSDADDGLVYIHPTSPMAHLSTQECPEFVVYAYLQRATSPPTGEGSRRPKTRMHALTDVSGAQLAGLARGTPLLGYGKPIKETRAPSVAKAEGGGATRECLVVPYLRAEDTGGLGWPLPARRVKQRRVAGKGWVVE